MTIRNNSGLSAPVSLGSPDDVLEAVPYLLGFVPASGSLVVIGTRSRKLVLTARLDVDMCEDPQAFATGVLDLMRTMSRNGVTEALAVGYDSGSDGLTASVAAAAAEVEIDLAPMLLVSDGWFCAVTPEGEILGGGRCRRDSSSATAAAFTYAGMSVAPSRDAVAAALKPSPGAAQLDGLVDRLLGEEPSGSPQSVTECIAAMALLAETDVSAISEIDRAQCTAALTRVAVRDAVWAAVDAGQVPGTQLFAALARDVTGPRRAAPLFLYGWASWRAGDGAAARIAAEEAVAADPGYAPAGLLIQALDIGLNPFETPAIGQ